VHHNQKNTSFCQNAGITHISVVLIGANSQMKLNLTTMCVRPFYWLKVEAK
jgi:hypothetical protein